VFDEVFPLQARWRTNVFWTPVEVAVRAAQLLVDASPNRIGRGTTILDIGSGIGKFCIVAAATVRAHVRGIEHRPRLVEIAREAAAKVGVYPSFDGSPIDAQEAGSIDGFYLFNPFAENLCRPADRIDGTVSLGPDRFRDDVDATVRLLSKARPGTRVVTYCGFGGELPHGFVRVLREQCAGGRLELWQKRAVRGL
jgi:SAM-dependent methyltransferase